MNTLETHINYLLATYDCVVIPQFGALIASVESAYYDAETDSFVPPRRVVSFNSELVHNDGMLIQSVARRQKTPYDYAQRLVADEVRQLAASIERTGSVYVEGLGEFRRVEGADGAEFVPAADCCANARYALLPTLHGISAPVVSEDAEADGEQMSRRWSRRYLGTIVKIAACIAVIVTLGVTFGDTVINRANFAAILPASAHKENVEIASAKTPVVVAEPMAQELLIAVPALEEEEKECHDCNNVQSSTVPMPVSMPADKAVDNALNQYCLIVASLPTQASAEKYIAEQGDSELRILHKDGRFRIYAATGATYADAQAQAAKVSARYPESWVCRR